MTTDAPCTTLPTWPPACPASGGSATLKALNGDFVGTELPLQLPGGAGEQLWLAVAQRGASTAEVAQPLLPEPLSPANARSLG